MDWLIAVVTPVPKIPRPTGPTDYRPISVTPILSHVAEDCCVAVVETCHNCRYVG